MKRFGYTLSALLMATCLLMGCSPDSDVNTDVPVGPTTGGDHHHGHAHRHGPMGGELFEVADAKMNVECVAKYGQNLIIVQFYGEDAKTAHPIGCKKVIANYTFGTKKSVSLEGVDSDDDNCSKFEIENEEFALARKSSGFELEFEYNGNKCTVDVPKDPH